MSLELRLRNPVLECFCTVRAMSNGLEVLQSKSTTVTSAHQCFQIWGIIRWASETSRSSAPQALLQTCWNGIYGSRIQKHVFLTSSSGGSDEQSGLGSPLCSTEESLTIYLFCRLWCSLLWAHSDFHTDWLQRETYLFDCIVNQVRLEIRFAVSFLPPWPQNWTIASLEGVL